MVYIATGYLQVITRLNHQVLSVNNCYIRLIRMHNNTILYEDFFMSDNNGMSMSIPCWTIEKKNSLEVKNKDEVCTYYCVEIRKAGFITQIIDQIPIFADICSILPVTMIVSTPSLSNIQTTVIPFHQLQKTTASHHESATYASISKEGRKENMLSDVIIPTNITVHLGKPDQNAENVTVPFLYYLKNVASSEIYPTWPEEAIKANVWAQISLVLNRVFTEWYPSQGYNFDITNSTAYDQAFVKNRNIYTNISAIVEEVFNEYIQKRNFQEPFYAEYCDGKIAQCPGMKQWGTLDLANRGYPAIDILQYYYGDQIRIIESNNIQPIQASYPGTPFRRGMRGEQIKLLQAQLNGVAINYPIIPPVFPVDGIFTAATEESVKAFQKTFNLTADGIIGKATYYELSFIYTAVRKLAELGSLGQIENLYTGEWPGTVLKKGNRGVETQLLQYYLSSISLFYPEIPPESIDGRFGEGTENAVIAFQKRFNLTTDGLVGNATWTRIYEIYTSIQDQLQTGQAIPLYPGSPLVLNDSGPNVTTLQVALQQLSKRYPNIPTLTVDGIYGTGTQQSVKAFQNVFSINADGIVDVNTWNAIFESAAQIQSLTPVFMQDGQDGTAIAHVQKMLQKVAVKYPQLPNVSISKKLDDATLHAIKAFRKLLDIPSSELIDLTIIQKLENITEELSF